MPQRLHKTGLFTMRDLRVAAKFEREKERRTEHFYIVVTSGPLSPKNYQSRFASHFSTAWAEFAGTLDKQRKGLLQGISCSLCTDTRVLGGF